MDEYGSITIDNKNLLDDLLGLGADPNQNDELSLFQPRRNFSQPAPPPPQSQAQNFQSNYSQGRKILLESPTFTKKEDDIYRYVHSRISNADTNASRDLHDSLEDPGAIRRNGFVDNNQRIEEYPTEPQRRIGSNRLLSDLAVASLGKQNFAQSQPKALRQNNLDDTIYENDLLDSLDTNNNQQRVTNQINNNSYTNPQQQFYNQQIQQNLNQAPTRLSQQYNEPQYNQYNPAQALQAQSPQQYQQILPFQGVQQIPPGVILLQSPTIPVNTSLQFNPQAPQFIPVAFQQPNMFYQEPIQPIFYNTAYPLSLPLQNQNNYDYPSDPYQQYQQQELYNQQQYDSNRNYNQNGLQSVVGTRYDAQPLQPPSIPQQQQQQLQQQPQQQVRQINRSNLKFNSQQSQDPYEMNSPDSEDGELVNEFNQMRVNTNGSTGLDQNENESDSRAQEVWNKLQKAREIKDKNSGQKTKQKPSSSNNIPVSVHRTTATYKKPPLPESSSRNNRNDTNFLEKNMEAIRNKENLTHRYPEKKYENVHGKNASSRVKHFQSGSSSDRKPPHHLQPLENYNDEDEEVYQNELPPNFKSQSDNYNFNKSNKKISIPLDPSKFKDQDHINVDINLRLVDFLPPNQINGSRTVDDFDVNNDPLARYIKNYETNISRSLPGSSGSLNKHKHLPPVQNRRILQKPFSHQEGRLQHEYDNEVKTDDGYLAQMQRAQSKPVIRTYTLKDYRNFKKDALPSTNTNTGKLGFDFESEDYKQKLETAQKKNDYAERVKLRNRILISEKKRNDESESNRSQQPAEPSKTQRAKEYVQNHVIRTKSASEVNSQQNGGDEFKPKDKKRSAVSRKPTDTITAKSAGNLPSQAPPKAHSVMSRPRDSAKPDDTAIVRIRDPVTSKVRTIYLNDSQIEELSKRHQQDKERVNNVVLNRNNSHPADRPRQPIAIKEPKQIIEEVNEEPIFQEIQPKPARKIETEPAIKKKPINLNLDDDNFEKLLQRHQNEKKIVGDFDGTPYVSEEVEQQINKKSLSNSNQNQIEVE